MKLRVLIPLVSLAFGPISAPAYDWGANGVPVAGGLPGQDAQKILPDGAGGAYIAWRDVRHGTGSDVYLQRITATGEVAPGWPADGLPVCTHPSQQELADIAPDGEEGVLLVWVDSRGPGTSLDIYAHRVLPNGTLAPGWPLNGMPVSRDSGYESAPVIEHDGTGGAYIGWSNWTDYGYTSTAFAQHLTAAGLPASGWPQNGKRLSQVPSGVLRTIADGVDGAVFIWGQVRGDSADVYAAKLTPSGEIAVGWPSEGMPIALGCGGRDAIPDGAGGFYAVCAHVNLQGGTEYEYEFHRWTFAGQRALGWPDAGLRFAVAPGNRVLSPATFDGFGGALLGWFDYRNSQGGSDVYATRVLPDATFAPGWPQDGVLASDPTQGLETNVDIASDGSGGGYLVWQWDTFSSSFSKIQHLAADGHVAPGWPTNGIVVSQQSSQVDPAVASDGSGGAIVVWDHTSLFAQHFSSEAPVPTLPEVNGIEATQVKVTLTWFAAEIDGAIRVYRRSDGSGWESLGSAVPDGPSQLRFEDGSVTPGTRYAYRLGIADGGSEIFTAETWVDVPSQLRLALDGFRPNPARVTMQVAFTLPTAAPARLELIDVAGRIMAHHEVGSLGPGRHVIDPTRGSNAAAGVYWIRLTQGGKSLTTRGVVVP